LDHDGIITQMKLLESLVKSFKVNDSVDELSEKFNLYEKDLELHLVEEEEIGLPLMRAYFSQKDLKPAINQIIKTSPKYEAGSMAATGGVETFRNTFMRNENIPFFVWYIDFYWKYRAFVKQFVTNIQALTEGVEPPKKGFF
jgi:hypothetical protein